MPSGSLIHLFFLTTPSCYRFFEDYRYFYKRDYPRAFIAREILDQRLLKTESYF